MGNLLIGSYVAKIDKSGRIKIPEKFRAAIEADFGNEVFITSLTDEAVQIYPLPVWEELTGVAKEGALHLRPDVRNFLLRVNRRGVRNEIDSKGRVLINSQLRGMAQLTDEVEVIGLNNHLEVWNREKLDEKLERRPLTDKDFESIASLIPRGKPE
ncbi:MAG: division/cell wall cluster transcriptional repressor MraZ [Candidatus Aminicenantales bacterium]